ncbi:MAG: helix-turn-helix transcriptional regulator [Patescibacteria group bacterium]
MKVEDKKNIFGSILRELRNSKQMSPAEVVIALDKIGLRRTVNWLSMLENGRSDPSLESWLFLLQIYDCDPVQFFGLMNNKTAEPFISPISRAPADFWVLSGFWDGVSYQLPGREHNFADFKIGFGIIC